MDDGDYGSTIAYDEYQSTDGSGSDGGRDVGDEVDDYSSVDHYSDGSDYSDDPGGTGDVDESDCPSSSNESTGTSSSESVASADGAGDSESSAGSGRSDPSGGWDSSESSASGADSPGSGHTNEVESSGSRSDDESAALDCPEDGTDADADARPVSEATGSGPESNDGSDAAPTGIRSENGSDDDCPDDQGPVPAPDEGRSTEHVAQVSDDPPSDEGSGVGPDGEEGENGSVPTGQVMQPETPSDTTGGVATGPEVSVPEVDEPSGPTGSPEPLPVAAVASPAPGSLNWHPALSAIDADGITGQINELEDFKNDLAASQGMSPQGVPTLESALARVQDGNGHLQTSSGMPLGTLGSNSDFGAGTGGAVVAANIAPYNNLIYDEFGAFRPHAGIFAPELAQRRTDLNDGILNGFFGTGPGDPGQAGEFPIGGVT